MGFKIFWVSHSCREGNEEDDSFPKWALSFTQVNTLNFKILNFNCYHSSSVVCDA